MSLRFSRVTAISDQKASIFLVGGIPRSSADLENWNAYQDFLDGLESDPRIVVHVETFIYGGEEPNDATPEEIAYFYMRMEKRPDFIETRAEKISESDFLVGHP